MLSMDLWRGGSARGMWWRKQMGCITGIYTDNVGLREKWEMDG